MSKTLPLKTLPVVENAKIIAKTKVFTVEQMQLRFSNGQSTVYERIVSGANGAVLVVPFLDAETFLLIREYCAGVQRYEIAFPKGRVEGEESILESANRELKEETGYGANLLRLVKSVSVSPGYISHCTHIVLASDLYEQKLPGDEPEPIEVIPWKMSQVNALLQHEEFTEARSIAALYLVKTLF